MLKVYVIGNSGHDGDMIEANGTMQQALANWFKENSGLSDCLTIVIQKDHSAIVGRDLEFNPRLKP